MFAQLNPTQGGITILTLALAAPGLLADGPPPDGPEIAFRVRAYAEKRVRAETLRGAVDVAGELVSKAGIAGTWRLCDTAASCPLVESRVPEIVVILSRRTDPKRPGRCGIAALGTNESSGTVTVSVPCVENVVARLQRQSATKSNPFWAVARYDDIVGAVIAHEIGHLLGLPHAPAGLMRASLEADEILGLRRGTLAFSHGEASSMRIALVRARLEGMRAARR
jgi:hypothetical protein